MLYYARADTHYLLYIYDQMRNELIEKSSLENTEENLIDIVLQKSKETSLSRYERQVYNAESGKGPGGWFSLLLKTPSMFNKEQFAVFRAVHAWRDKIARIDDDSPTFLMPNHILFSIAKIMPTDLLSLLRTAHPVTYGVKSRADELLEIIKAAQETGHTGPSITDFIRPRSTKASTQANLQVVSQDSNMDNVITVSDEGELRSEDSSFWGTAFGSSMWDIQNQDHNDPSRLLFRVPIVPTDSFTENVNLYETQSPKLLTQPSVSIRPSEEEVFVLKRGIKRKSDAALAK